HRPFPPERRRSRPHRPEPEQPASQDPRIHETIREARRPSCADRLNPPTDIGQLIGPTGFVALSRLDQGALMSLHGEPVDTTQYLVGNPLIARRIIGLNRTAALHAPFPLAIYRDDQGVHVAYTQPSSSFGSLGSADIDLIAKELDAMILGTVEQVCRT